MTEVTTPSDASAQEQPPASLTVPRLWQDGVAAGRTEPPYLVEEPDGSWRPVSWAEADAAVTELANGLLAEIGRAHV